MNKRNYTCILYSMFLVILLSFSFINILIKEYNEKITAIALLVLGGVSLVKFRKNKKIFFILLMLFYFNYSVVICRYLFGKTELLETLYEQLFSKETMGLSINLLLVFNTIILMPICLYINKTNDKGIEKVSKFDIIDLQYKKLILMFFKLIIIVVFFYHIYKKITYNTTIFEYLFIIFIFAFLIAKGDKKEQRIFEIMLIICSIYSLYIGERIGVLQFLIADFVINYLDKIKIRTTVIMMICGVCLFTFIGVYGDILDSSGDFKNLTISNVVQAFSERRFALDTSVSAYFTGTSMIDISNVVTYQERINNFKDYILDYTIKGNKSNYIDLPKVIRKYQKNYAGGYITGYFYYWLGFIGVVVIALYIGFIIRKIIKIDETSSNFIKIYSVYFITALPRWYMYVPSLLFRGSLIFIILYLILRIFMKKI